MLGDRTGWCLQQFVKLFAYKELGPSISRRFALLDSDLVLQAPFRLFTEEGKVVISTSGIRARYGNKPGLRNATEQREVAVISLGK